MNILSFFRNSILPIKEINDALPDKGYIYELGCGYGTLAYEIAKYNKARQVIAIDLNTNKISTAKRNYHLKNLEFIEGNVTTFSYKLFAGAVMSDFLHHINYSSQERLITNLSKSIKHDGVLVIKEIDDDDGWRKILSRLWDWILYPKDRIFYRSKRDWLTLLLSNGFAIKVSRKSVFFPGSTYLYICTKKT